MWGVVWLTARHDRCQVVNLINYRHEPVTVLLSARGKRISGLNLFTSQPAREPIVLPLLEPLLLEVK